MGYSDRECLCCYLEGDGNNPVGSDYNCRHPVCLICIANIYGCFNRIWMHTYL